MRGHQRDLGHKEGVPERHNGTVHVKQHGQRRCYEKAPKVVRAREAREYDERRKRGDAAVEPALELGARVRHGRVHEIRPDGAVDPGQASVATCHTIKLPPHGPSYAPLVTKWLSLPR